MDALTREGFLKLSWEDQKKTDLRRVIDPGCVGPDATDLVANCICHQDETASMVIYANAVYCFGCKVRLWPDQFLLTLGDRTLVTERGSRKGAAPKYIPLSVVDTFRRWLWSSGTPVSEGHYAARSSWLTARGLSRDICHANWIGHTGEAFTIPLFGPGKRVESIRYRRDDELAAEDRPKYWGTAGANQAKLYLPTRSPGQMVNYTYGVILCEGELDALRLVQEGYPAVSMTNGCNALKPEHVEELRTIPNLRNRVTVCYDMDDPGRNGAARAVDMLEQAGFKTHALAWHPQYGKDVTEFLLNRRPIGLETGGERILSYLLESLWRLG